MDAFLGKRQPLVECDDIDGIEVFTPGKTCSIIDLNDDNKYSKTVKNIPEKFNVKNGSNESKETLNVLDDNKSSDVIKIACWNVNGMLGVIDSGDIKKYLDSAKIDVVCFNETKIQPQHTKSDMFIEAFKNYEHQTWSCCKTNFKDYSGVGIASKRKPLSIKEGFGKPFHSREGRCITYEYDKLYLVAVYVPNSGAQLKRIDYRTKEWDPDFKTFLNDLKSKKPTIVIGDLNVAHQAIDLANPQSNIRTAGFTEEERASFSKLLSSGWTDTFRKLNPAKKQYSFFTSRFPGMREKNVGWRLDYSLASDSALKAIINSTINDTVYGSDHVPIEVDIDLAKL